MAFDFPATPALDEIYTSGGISYRWDGSAWRSGDTTPITPVYVLKAGDTMGGNLMQPLAPTAPTILTNKKYVDETIAAMALYQGTWQVAANVPDLNVPPNAPLNGYAWIAQTVDPNTPEVAPATIPGIGGMTIGSTDTVKWNGTTLVYDLIRGANSVSAITIADGPPGSAFPGQLWWDSNNGKHYAYFDDGTSSQWVQISGGGGGSVVGIPDDAPVDTKLYGRRDAAWAEVTGAGGGIPEAPIDTKQYARQDAAWTEVTATGFVDAPTDTKQYARQSATVGATPAWTEVTAAAGGPVVVPVADTFPAAPVQGLLHFLTTDASLYIYYDDGTTAQWVEVSAL